MAAPLTERVPISVPETIKTYPAGEVVIFDGKNHPSGTVIMGLGETITVHYSDVRPAQQLSKHELVRGPEEDFTIQPNSRYSQP